MRGALVFLREQIVRDHMNRVFRLLARDDLVEQLDEGSAAVLTV
jgi:hypothetical protein